MSKRILIGVSGGIAAYKVVDYVRQFQKAGYKTTLILTRAAEMFVSKLALEVVSGEKVYTDDDMLSSHSYHLTLSRSSHYFIIIPATANTLAKCAHGLCDDLLSTTFLSFQGAKAICPAMHSEMFLNLQTQRNIRHLEQSGVCVIGPGKGDLACGDSGVGRLIDVALILAWIQLAEKKHLQVKDKTIAITMGGTREPIDSVRWISNGSSGKLGEALAMVGQLYGASISLITTVPVSDMGYTDIRYVDTVDSMKNAMLDVLDRQDALIMAAAVSDFKAVPSDRKLRRSSSLMLQLEGTEDILKNLPRSPKRQTIGFCLADGDVVAIAKEKLISKNVDVLIANHASTMGKDIRDFWVLKKGEEPLYNEGLSVIEMAYEIVSCLNIV